MLFYLQKGRPEGCHIHCLSRKTGLLQSAGHEVAFHTAGNGAAGFPVRVLKSFGKVLHDPRVSAAVAAGTGADVDNPGVKAFCLVGGKFCDNDLPLSIIGFNFSVLTHDVDVPVDAVGLGCEGESGGHTVLKFQNHTHVVADIVGKDKIKDLIGTFLQCDPNEINILYLKVLETYNTPLNDFNMQRTNEMIDNANIESLKELLVTAEKAAKLKLND